MVAHFPAGNRAGGRRKRAPQLRAAQGGETLDPMTDEVGLAPGCTAVLGHTGFAAFHAARVTEHEGVWSKLIIGNFVLQLRGFAYYVSNLTNWDRLIGRYNVLGLRGNDGPVP